MLTNSRVEANILASHLDRARDSYRLTDEVTASVVHPADLAGQAGHTIAQWHVDDVDAQRSAP